MGGKFCITRNIFDSRLADARRYLDNAIRKPGSRLLTGEENIPCIVHWNMFKSNVRNLLTSDSTASEMASNPLTLMNQLTSRASVYSMSHCFGRSSPNGQVSELQVPSPLFQTPTLSTSSFPNFKPCSPSPGPALA